MFAAEQCQYYFNILILYTWQNHLLVVRQYRAAMTFLLIPHKNCCFVLSVVFQESFEVCCSYNNQLNQQMNLAGVRWQSSWKKTLSSDSNFLLSEVKRLTSPSYDKLTGMSLKKRLLPIYAVLFNISWILCCIQQDVIPDTK